MGEILHCPFRHPSEPHFVVMVKVKGFLVRSFVGMVAEKGSLLRPFVGMVAEKGSLLRPFVGMGDMRKGDDL